MSNEHSIQVSPVAGDFEGNNVMTTEYINNTLRVLHRSLWEHFQSEETMANNLEAQIKRDSFVSEAEVATFTWSMRGKKGSWCAGDTTSSLVGYKDQDHCHQSQSDP